MDVKNVLRSGAGGTKNVPNLDRKLAALLGTTAQNIAVTDVLVYPPTGNTLVSVMRGDGQDALPALVKVDGAGTLGVVALEKIRYSKVNIPNPPPPVSSSVLDGKKYETYNYPNRPKDPTEVHGTRTVTHMAYQDGRLYASGLSNEEFASKLWSIAYPFAAIDRGTSVEIWHTSHGLFETRSPVYSFVPYTLHGERY